MAKSDISGFYKLSVDKRLKLIKGECGLNDDETAVLERSGALDLDIANRMIENVIGTTALPFGIGCNFLINDRDYLIPMVIEEPSVVAAASFSAKLARARGGFKATATEPLMFGQVQIVNLENAGLAAKEVLRKKKDIIELANAQDKVLVERGGGVKDLEVKAVKTKRGEFLITQLLVDVRDAMGANAVNTMCEAVAPYIQGVTGGKIRLRIISNLATKRIAKAEAIFGKEVVGEEVVEGVLDAYEFAANDVYRCATHNKGIMNGIDAVVVATGNDWRAVEAGAHAYASLNGYKPLTKYEKTKEGDLKGVIELPIAVGTVGGAIRTHPIAKIAMKILNVSSSREFAMVLASVGLAQNFAAIRALATEGIQRGHMELHARNIAVLAGAKNGQIDAVAKKMIEEKNIRVDRAREILSSQKTTSH